MTARPGEETAVEETECPTCGLVHPQLEGQTVCRGFVSVLRKDNERLVAMVEELSGERACRIAADAELNAFLDRTPAHSVAIRRLAVRVGELEAAFRIGLTAVSCSLFDDTRKRIVNAMVSVLDRDWRAPDASE